MAPADLVEVIRVIRLFDTDDAVHAKPYFEWYVSTQQPPQHRNLVAVENGQIVGVGGFEPAESEADEVYWISWFYVHPDHHATGIGGQLMRKVLRTLKALKARKVYVDVSSYHTYAPARRFYDRHGFIHEATLKDYYADGEDCIYLAKTLRQADTG